MELVDENEGYDSEDDQQDFFEETKSAPVIRFLDADEIQPFSFGTVKPKPVPVIE